MKDPIKLWLDHRVAVLQQSGDLSDSIEYCVEVERTKNKLNGDYASNIALILAKQVGMAPRGLAELIIKTTDLPDFIKTIDLAGPGFINFFLNMDLVAKHLDQRLNDKRVGVAEVAIKQKIVVDYSSPNLAKEMHVGHLRTTVIGDALVRVLGYLGHEVIRQNHVGDWGTQFGMLLAYMEQEKITDLAELNHSLADLEVFYRSAKLAFDQSPEFAKRARQLVVQLQQGDTYCRKLWEKFATVSMAHCQKVYDLLGVLLKDEDRRGESSYQDALPLVINILRAKGLLTESQGALCVFSKTLKNKEQEPLPLLVQKNDGGYLYATTDLAALQYRLELLQVERVIYVVDQRQALHFQQVFEVANRLGWLQDKVSLEFVGFGTVNDADGKPFKTRSGGTTKLIELINQAKSMAKAEVLAKNPDMSQDQLDGIADVMGIAAIKYADLSKNRVHDYMFSFEHMLSFDGNTAPYMLYAYARIHSVLAKASYATDSVMLLEHESEIDLAKELLDFPERIQQVAATCCPHYLCHHLYEVATLFMRFYEHCPILHQPKVRQHSRLRLCHLTARTLEVGLGLLGIAVLDQM